MLAQEQESNTARPPRRRQAPPHTRAFSVPHHSLQQKDALNSFTSSRWRLSFIFFATGSVVICVIQIFGLGHQLIQWHQKEYYSSHAIINLQRLPLKTRNDDQNLHKQQHERSKQRLELQTTNLVLTAFLEPPVLASWQIENDDKNNVDYDLYPPRFTQPLPRRTTTPEDLIQITYPHVVACNDIPTKWPVDCGPMVFKAWTWNATWEYFQQQQWLKIDSNSNRWKCPVVGDAFLPWIHDVVVNDNATRVHIVAQNYGRCNTGPEHRSWLHTLQPQGALLQAVSVQRIKHDDPSIPSDLWKPTETETTNMPRYRLAPREQSDPDGQSTRFICRFHAHHHNQPQLADVYVEETLSVYPFDYEFMDFRRLHPTLLHPLGRHQTNPLTSTLLFDCPIPMEVSELITLSTADVYLDIIPIRTPPRYGLDQVYLTEEMAGPKSTWHIQNISNTSRSLWRNLTSPIAGFDPVRAWGRDHVLPAVEASGRWANIPLCKPPSSLVPRKVRRSEPTTTATSITSSSGGDPLYELTACTWVSASYHTRSKDERGRHHVTDTVDRLKEWLEFHLMVGVDHIYVYDNSNAGENNGGKAIRDVVKSSFSSDEVTYIDWPHQICNNRPAPPVENAGERSSQYAAEASCRMRYGPHTKWMISSLDVDEYLIPIYPNYRNLKQLLQVMEARNQTLLSFRSTRAKLRHDASEALRNDSKATGLRKLPSKTFLEAYNCDGATAPKPESANRARKEIYRPHVVLYHFVHYSLVTRDMTKTYSELGPKQYQRDVDEPEFVPDEKTEAVMLHTKTPTFDQTKFYQRRCHFSRKKAIDCIVGFPSPHTAAFIQVRNSTQAISDSDGYLYNCFPIECIDSYWKFRLAEAIEARRRIKKAFR